MHEKEVKKRTTIQQFISTIIFAFFLSFLLLTTINILLWHKNNNETIIRNLKTHYKIEVNRLRKRNEQLVIYLVAFSKLLEKEVGKITNIKALTKKVGTLKNKTQRTKFSEILKSNLKFIETTTKILCLTFLILLFKLINILGSVLLYTFAILIGALDGLIKRDIRTCECGRESTFMFHRVTKAILLVSTALIVIYLISPILINPTLIVMSLALSLFYVFHTTTASLKKFL